MEIGIKELQRNLTGLLKDLKEDIIVTNRGEKVCTIIPNKVHTSTEVHTSKYIPEPVKEEVHTENTGVIQNFKMDPQFLKKARNLGVKLGSEI